MTTTRLKNTHNIKTMRQKSDYKVLQTTFIQDE